MALRSTTSLDAVENGAAARLERGGYSYLVRGTFVGTIKAQLSFDGGTNWVELDSHTAAAVKPALELGHAAQLRFICSAYTSGTAVCELYQ